MYVVTFSASLLFSAETTTQPGIPEAVAGDHQNQEVSQNPGPRPRERRKRLAVLEGRGLGVQQRARTGFTGLCGFDIQGPGWQNWGPGAGRVARSQVGYLV